MAQAMTTEQAYTDSFSRFEEHVLRPFKRLRRNLWLARKHKAVVLPIQVGQFLEYQAAAGQQLDALRRLLSDKGTAKRLDDVRGKRKQLATARKLVARLALGAKFIK